MADEPNRQLDPTMRGRAERSARSFLVEGLVIVASILLAFAIDAGWDELREREQEQRLLAQVTDELGLFIDRLGPASRRVTDRVDADTTRLLEYIHGSGDDDPEALLDAISWLHRAYEFSAATPVIDQLTGDGGLQMISNPVIREELSNVASFFGVVGRFEELQGEFITREMIPWLNRNIDRYAISGPLAAQPSDSPSSRFDSDLGAIRTREFSNLLIERQRLLYLVTVFRGQTLERMEVLRELIWSQLED